MKRIWLTLFRRSRIDAEIAEEIRCHLANNTVPLPAAMGPSTLLPSHDQTTFHDCPAARTPGIRRPVGGRTGSGGAAFPELPAMGLPNGRRRILALREHVFQSGILPVLRTAATRKRRGWRSGRGTLSADDSRCSAAGDYHEKDLRFHYLIPFDCTSQFEFVQRPHFLPANILPAFLSPLNVHRSQFDATLANSPPPG